MNQRFEAGQFITFTYNPPEKPVKQPRPTVTWALQPDGSRKQVVGPTPAPIVQPPTDKNKEVFVLHPNWHNKIHAVDMKHLTPAEAGVLRAVMDPAVKAAIDGGQWPVENVPPYPLIRDILRRMDPVDLIKNPLAFYQRLIKPFIRSSDCYRQYWPQYVYGVKVIQESHVQGKITNPAPLFKKI